MFTTLAVVSAGIGKVTTNHNPTLNVGFAKQPHRASIPAAPKGAQCATPTARGVAFLLAYSTVRGNLRRIIFVKVRYIFEWVLIFFEAQLVAHLVVHFPVLDVPLYCVRGFVL